MKKEEFTIEDEIRSLMNGDTVDDAPEEEVIDEVPEDTTPAADDTAKTVDVPAEEQAPVEEVEPAPVSLSGAIKEKWKDLPADVRQEWSKRENDIHRMMTSHEGELRMGRDMKEVITPYMALIQSEGGTPAGAVRDLLNTAYVLRTGHPQQKAQLLLEVAQQYGVDLSLAAQPQQDIDPNMRIIMQEIQQLRQQANPEVLKTQLQDEMTRDMVSKEVSEFAANSSNVHFQTVRSSMGPLMMSGQAKNLQEAYDMACWANPTIRSTLLTAQNEQIRAKQKQEMDAKRKAAASVTGSPDMTSPQNRTPMKSLEDEIRDLYKEQQGGII